MSNTKTLSEIINQPIPGSVKTLDEVVHMLHTINGRLIEIAEKLGIEEKD